MAARSIHTTRFFDDQAPASLTGVKRHGFFDRLVSAIARSRQAAAEREVALLIERGGFKMTDEMERRIGNHFV